MKYEPQHYIDCGYEDCGYVSPELSSSEEYPDYIKEEVENSVRKILSHQNFDTVTFGFMTDIHYALSYNHKIRFRRTMNAYREIAKRVFIDKLFLGGDYTNEGCKEHKTKCFNELRAEFDEVNYFPVHGNHDDGTIWDKFYIENDKDENHLDHGELYKLFYNHIPSKGAQLDKDNPSLYYLVDEPSTKTRYVCLDMNDIPYIFNDKGILKYRGQHLFTMSQKQLDWLVNKALRFDEDGWSVAFVAHCVSRPSAGVPEEETMVSRLIVFNKIISAFKSGGVAKASLDDGEISYNIDVDFKEYTKADIIGVFVGDYHTDAVEKDDVGIPYILTANAVMYCTSNPNYVQRYDGDKTEILFDIVTVDKNKRKIFITRVGAGEDRIVEY